jgi:hypothetical protein
VYIDPSIVKELDSVRQETVRMLGHLPLAIDRVGAYICVRKLPLDRFLQQFNE